jgi:hypothetical protein
MNEMEINEFLNEKEAIKGWYLREIKALSKEQKELNIELKKKTK